MAKETGTKENPWQLKTPPLSSEFTMHKDEKDGKEIFGLHRWKNCVTLRLSLFERSSRYVKKTRQLDGTRQCR